jgi:opacity protein-like surface antigen
MENAMKVVNSLNLAAAAGALVLACTTVQANEGPKFYAGVGYSHMSFDAHETFELPITTFHAGLELSKNLRIEARYGINAGDNEQDYSDSGYDIRETIEVNNYWGVIAKGVLPVTDIFSVYGMVGLNSLSVDDHGRVLDVYNGDIYTFSGESKETSTTLGAGVELKLGDSFALSAEYQLMVEDVSGFNVGLSYRF